MTPDRTELALGYEALRRGVGAYRHMRAVVRVTGPDSSAYLQGQVSQDLTPLLTGGSAEALLLEPDGKLTALVRVTRTADDAYVLDTDAGFAEVVVDRLRRFRLRTKVEIDADEWPCVGLRGAQVPAATELGGSQGPPWVVPVEWNGTRGADLLGPGAGSSVPTGARTCEVSSWEALRVEAGIPKMGAELDGRTIAAEAGIVERTVNFAKGCYTGQELVARLDARGNRVSRRLCGVIARFDAGAVGGVEPEELTDATLHRAGSDGADKPAGRVTSAAWSPALGTTVGLAYLHRSVEVPASLVARTEGGGRAVELRVADLPLVPG